VRYATSFNMRADIWAGFDKTPPIPPRLKDSRRLLESNIKSWLFSHVY
jgi:hypothetical protein